MYTHQGYKTDIFLLYIPAHGGLWRMKNSLTVHSRRITERHHQQRRQIRLFRGEIFSRRFYESALQESHECQNKEQRAGGYPYSICGSTFIGEQILGFKVMEVLLWGVGDGEAGRCTP